MIITRAIGEKIKIGPIVIGYCGVNEHGEAVIHIIAPRNFKIDRMDRNHDRNSK